ncbi:bifunctional AP-4-A phosphorylase/ADP sulfurylase [Malassezia pachydermatis]
MLSLRRVPRLFRARPLMTATQASQIAPLVSQQYDKAIREGDAFFYDSDVHVIEPRVGKDEESIKTVPWHVRNVPALLKKRQAKSEETKEKESKPQQNSSDVFAPPYVPNLLVKEGPDFTVLVRCVYLTLEAQ